MIPWRFLAAFIFAFPSIAYACTCFGPRFFHEAAKSSQVIVHARVIEYVNYSGRGAQELPLTMVVEVINPIRQATKGEKMIVWGDAGFYCGASVSNFPIGTEWIFALESIPGEAPLPKSGAISIRNFGVSFYGVHWLKVTGTGVVENFENPMRKQKYP